jgi:hypothetical protein
MLSNRGIKMKAFSLLIFLIFGSFVFQVQAMKPSGGAIGGAIPSLDVKKCDLKARGQSKLTVKDTSGKTHFLCLGMAVCEGKKKEVACEIREKDSCPTSQTCASVPVSRKDFSPRKARCDLLFFYNTGSGSSINSNPDDCTFYKMEREFLFPSNDLTKILFFNFEVGIYFAGNINAKSNLNIEISSKFPNFKEMKLNLVLDNIIYETLPITLKTEPNDPASRYNLTLKQNYQAGANRVELKFEFNEKRENTWYPKNLNELTGKEIIRGHFNGEGHY